MRKTNKKQKLDVALITLKCEVFDILHEKTYVNSTKAAEVAEWVENKVKGLIKQYTKAA